MYRISRSLFQSRRLIHTQSHNPPSETLKKTVSEMRKKKKNKTNRSKMNDEFLVEVPESMAYLDTLKMPVVLTAVAVVLFAKVLMLHDESKSQERIERKIRNAPEGQGTVRMLSPEEWEEIQEVRPRTPFESKLARPNARLRTDEPLRMGDVKDWGIDVLTDALTRVEDSIRRGA
ncbi:uncharacterized protein LOC113328248 [Papaver somniferum]|uniref:uncharacterized protein LOC113328248 n=1 Tax=Papaver somniferum TaxID=3469 RepID=UPI000E6F9E3B|nr:uncharacterized protein LOC113328248 [Papaver somniferum]